LDNIINEDSIPFDLDFTTIDTNFIKYCITALGTRDNRGKKTVDTPLLQEINNFYATDFQPINNHQKYQLNNLSFTLPYVCSSIEVSIKNNIKEHFIKRLSKFISIIGGNYYEEHYSGELTDRNTKEYKKEKNSLLYKVKKCIIENKPLEIPTIMNGWYITIKDKITPPNILLDFPALDTSPFLALGSSCVPAFNAA
jgi:hypothetical protein